MFRPLSVCSKLAVARVFEIVSMQFVGPRKLDQGELWRSGGA